MYNESLYNTRNECGVTDDMDELWQAIERYELSTFDAIVYDEGSDCGDVDPTEEPGIDIWRNGDQVSWLPYAGTLNELVNDLTDDAGVISASLLEAAGYRLLTRTDGSGWRYDPEHRCYMATVVAIRDLDSISKLDIDQILNT